MSEKQSPMFDFGDGRGRLITWNPIRMKRCPNECYNNDGKTGCWANALREGKLKATYENAPFLQYISRKDNQRWKEGQECIVFVGSMCDMFIHAVPAKSYLNQVMTTIRQNPKTTFLLMTKTPTRYVELLAKESDFFPDNILFGITIESNRDYPEISKGDLQSVRLASAIWISAVGKPVFISIEPILNFDITEFAKYLQTVKPWGVAVGFDNYSCGLNEPSLEKTLKLIELIEKFTKVFRKTLRDTL